MFKVRARAKRRTVAPGIALTARVLGSILPRFSMPPARARPQGEPMKRLLAALLCISGLALGCTKENHPPSPDAAATTAPEAAAPATAGDLPPDSVVATIDGKNVTAKELDEDLKPQLDQLAHKYQDDKFKLRQQGLDEYVLKKLVDGEAKKENLTEEQWLKKHVEDTVPQVPEAEAKKFYDENSAKMGGAPYDQIKDRLVGYLTNQKRQEAAAKLFDDLKAKAKVDIKLEEPVVKVEAIGPSMGPDNAPVTIVEFSDFQCPYCSKVEPTIKRVMADYAGKVRFVFRDYPLPFHEHAEKASEASHCAEAQDKNKYWPMHDAMFSNQDKLDVDGLKSLAKGIGLDEKKFAECLDSGAQKATVDANQKAGAAVGVQGTPHFFVNGHALNGAQPYEEFKKVIDHELAKVASAK
jgi:protein-disulfide isomerase